MPIKPTPQTDWGRLPLFNDITCRRLIHVINDDTAIMTHPCVCVHACVRDVCRTCARYCQENCEFFLWDLAINIPLSLSYGTRFGRFNCKIIILIINFSGA